MNTLENAIQFSVTDRISEISETELDMVSGGPLPLIAIAYAGIAISGTVLAAGTAFVVGVRTGYAVNRDTDSE